MFGCSRHRVIKENELGPSKNNYRGDDDTNVEQLFGSENMPRLKVPPFFFLPCHSWLRYASWQRSVPLFARASEWGGRFAGGGGGAGG